MISYLNSNCTVTFPKNEKDFIFSQRLQQKKICEARSSFEKKNMEIIFEITLSPDESESKSVVDSGFHSLSVELGFLVPILTGIPDSLNCIADSKAQNSGFLKHNFHGFRNPYSLTLCEVFLQLRIFLLMILFSHMNCPQIRSLCLLFEAPFEF